ncbi:archaea-specific SMC-related protein [Halobacterium sp. R2-5]|uniref:archaea-specific SMC-related protein n=1 Tax=Halobacterium sp. R2-5 TaxID=2715751 RepID=UPI0014207C97|nr:archaea-specific SMC-related protein [Halobacterium sp. R2-5]NIB99626.1 AAA family ATPase [Halobacterium sp. R2-5]
MGVQQSSLSDGRLRVENVGGIEQTDVEFTSGVNLLVGRNATNRTSLLQAFMAAMGSDQVTVKGDADAADVELELEGETYTRHLRRESGTVVTSGDPYLDDPELADLFAFLLESNDVRRAVERGDELHDLLLRPVDTEEIEAEIERLVDERDRVESDLDEIEEYKAELPAKEAEREELREEIEATKADLESAESELDAADDVEQRQQQKQELEEKLDELSSKRSELDDVRYDLETERERLSDLKSERTDLEDELDELPEEPEGDVGELESEVRSLRERKQELESSVSELRSVIGFNEDMLEDPDSDALAALDGDSDDGDVTDELLGGDDVVCWTCGSEVEAEQIDATVDQLREFSAEKLDDIAEVEERIEAKRERRRELEETREERERVERRLDRLADDVERCEENIDRLEGERDDLLDEIETVEAEVEELESEEYGEILEHHREANELEYELGRLEQDLEAVEADIADLEERIAEQDDLEARREELEDEIAELRTKIERIERDTVEEFNDHMAEVLEMLDYDNLDRIWLERREREVRRGRRTVTETAFDLHVVRTTDSGAAYEDTVEHLSESERETTGLVLALAGYLAHEVYEEVPYILLDSLEAIDSERIAQLVEYLGEYADYLVVALLTEDAQAVDSGYRRITEI